MRYTFAVEPKNTSEVCRECGNALIIHPSNGCYYHAEDAVDLKCSRAGLTTKTKNYERQI